MADTYSTAGIETLTFWESRGYESSSLVPSQQGHLIPWWGIASSSAITGGYQLFLCEKGHIQEAKLSQVETLHVSK